MKLKQFQIICSPAEGGGYIVEEICIFEKVQKEDAAKNTALYDNPFVEVFSKSMSQVMSRSISSNEECKFHTRHFCANEMELGTLMMERLTLQSAHGVITTTEL